MRLFYDIYLADAELIEHTVKAACTPWFTRGLSEDEELKYWTSRFGQVLSDGNSLQGCDFHINHEYITTLRFNLVSNNYDFGPTGIIIPNFPPDSVSAKKVCITFNKVPLGVNNEFSYVFEFTSGARSMSGGTILNGNEPNIF